MPVLYGFGTAQFALRELRYDVRQAVSFLVLRRLRLCSRFVLRGHWIDPVQYLAYCTVKSWIRWLRQPYPDQDRARLQRSWHRMHDFAYPAGTSSRGLIAPPPPDPTLPVDGSDSVGGYSGQHWVEVDCTIQFACRWHFGTTFVT